MKLLILILSPIAGLFIFFNFAYAADFDASYNVTYDVGEKGDTRVAQEVILTNNTKNKYATKYNLSVGSTKLKNFKAKDASGEIVPEIKVKEETTELSLNFNEKVIGLGKTLNFTLSYDSLETTLKNGRLWEINIPKLSAEENITNYILELKVPSSFGPKHYIKPQAFEAKEITNKRSYVFSKENLIKGGVVAVFGQEQVFDLNLKYHLYNPNMFAGYTEIALPPDTEYQQVSYNSLNPPPSQVSTDKDGNYIAKYFLKNGEKIDVLANLQIKTTAGDKKYFTKKWSQEELAAYLGPDKYWETNHPVIIEKAKELKTPEKIFEFVSTYLKYGYDRLKESKIERYGAVTALNHPEQAICMEYTDLMIAILRAAGIPAREINGYGYSENKKLRPVSIGGEEQSDILHSWPEYYDYSKKSWIQVDPTWSSTTGGVDYFNILDNNHLAFVIKGISSESPHPAGSYKYSPEQNKDVEVKFAEGFASTKAEAIVSLDNKNVISGFPMNSALILANKGGKAINSIQLTTQAPQIEVLPTNNLKVDYLPPYGKVVLDIKFREKNLFDNRAEEIKFLFTGKSGMDEINQEFRDSLQVKPFYIYAYLPILLISTPLLLLLIIFIIIKTQITKFKVPRQTPLR